MEIIQLDFLRKFSPNFLGIYNRHVILEIPNFKTTFNGIDVSFNLLSSGEDINDAECNMAKRIKLFQLDDSNLFNKVLEKMISVEIYSFNISILSDKKDDIFVLQLNYGNHSIMSSNFIFNESLKLLYNKFLTLN